MFWFFQTSSKTSRSMFSSKHRWNIASLSKKCDVLCDVLGFRWLGPTMLKMVRIFNINAYVIWYCWPCQYFCQQIIIKNTLLSHIVAKMKGFTCHFSIRLKCSPKTSLICIASTMFQLFSNIVKNIEVDVFFRTSPKNDIVKNWETSHRQKHRIVKKSEHRPPLILEYLEYLELGQFRNFCDVLL